jgi:hypothetical protein
MPCDELPSRTSLDASFARANKTADTESNGCQPRCDRTEHFAEVCRQPHVQRQAAVPLAGRQRATALRERLCVEGRWPRHLQPLEQRIDLPTLTSPTLNPLGAEQLLEK